MSETEIKLEQGMITYNPSSMEHKQQFFIDSFSNMKTLLEGVKQLAAFSKDVYENSSTTMKSKIVSVPDFDAIVEGVDVLLKKYEACCDTIGAESKPITEAQVMSAEELAKHKAKLLKEAEKKEMAALKQN